MIFGCYGKSGTPYKGNLRVRDADQGEQCRYYENPISWSQSGPTGPTGPTGPSGTAGPTALFNGGPTLVDSNGEDLITHVVTAGEAGLTILTAPCQLSDVSGVSGGSTTIDCNIRVNGIVATTHVLTLDDSGNIIFANSTSVTNIARLNLLVGDVVTVHVNTLLGSDDNEATANAQLLLEHVSS